MPLDFSLGVTRVFSRSRDIYVYLQAYKQQATTGAAPVTAQPVFAFVNIYSGDTKVFETPPTAVTPSTATRLGTMPLNFSLGVDTLPPGEYECQVTLLDPASQKTSFWRAPILLVP